jgi:hypothetical protein
MSRLHHVYRKTENWRLQSSRHVFFPFSPGGTSPADPPWGRRRARDHRAVVDRISVREPKAWSQADIAAIGSRGLERVGLRYGLALPATFWTAGALATQTAAQLGAALPDTAWTRVSWAECTKGPLVARFAAIRVRPAKTRGERWFLCERSLADDERKYYLLNLDATAPLGDLVAVVRSRWPIGQQCRRAQRTNSGSITSRAGPTQPGLSTRSSRPSRLHFFLQLERHRPTRSRDQCCGTCGCGSARSGRCSTSSTTATC